MHNLSELILKARRAGVTVMVTYDETAALIEGREIIESVSVIGLKGCGPFPMPALAASERMSELLA